MPQQRYHLLPAPREQWTLPWPDKIGIIAAASLSNGGRPDFLAAGSNYYMLLNGYTGAVVYRNVLPINASITPVQCDFQYAVAVDVATQTGIVVVKLGGYLQAIKYSSGLVLWELSSPLIGSYVNYFAGSPSLDASYVYMPIFNGTSGFTSIYRFDLMTEEHMDVNWKDFVSTQSIAVCYVNKISIRTSTKWGWSYSSHHDK